MMCLSTFIAVSAILMMGQTAMGSSPKPRQDVREHLRETACAVDGAAGAKAAWQAGVYDAQIIGRRLRRRSGRPASIKKAEAKAKALARVRHYGGYAAGTCADGSAWSVAVPSPLPLIYSKEALPRIPVKALTSRCDTWRVDFAPAGMGRPIKVSVTGSGHIKLGKSRLQAGGVIGVSCKPKRPRWLGPQLWFLLPIGEGPGKTLPGSQSFLSAKSSKESLRHWINTVRRSSGLTAVTFLAELDHEADLLAIGASVAHNRRMLERSSQNLQSHKIRLLGENRARGRTIKDIARMFWSSPRHRALLLNSKANVAGLDIRQHQGDTFVVLTMGTKARLKTATRRRP